MSDLISRQALQEWIKDKTFGDIVVASEHNFDCLPSVEPERKQGKWIENDTIRQCNMCRALYPKGQRCVAYHYCPNCGSKMEVDG